MATFAISSGISKYILKNENANFIFQVTRKPPNLDGFFFILEWVLGVFFP